MGFLVTSVHGVQTLPTHRRKIAVAIRHGQSLASEFHVLPVQLTFDESEVSSTGNARRLVMDQVHYGFNTLKLQ
jgi:hypothetical protein